MQGDTRLASLARLNGVSHPIVRFVAGFSRFLLHRWSASLEVRGVDRIASILRDPQRSRGVLTYANHISVIDDPAMFGALPRDLFVKARTTRWTLGASDIMFTNPFTSYLFRSGQVLATDRGRGVFQPALDRAIDVLDQRGSLHIFPEGYVNLSRKARVRRFKWGIGRILLESKLPIIVPCWISGFDQMMPDPRSFPKWLPRPGAKLSVTFGAPIEHQIEPLLLRLKQFAAEHDDNASSTKDLQAQLDAALEGTETLAPSYPTPLPSLFSPPTPITYRDEDVAPALDSRTCTSLRQGLDRPRARLARSAIASELRAHLVKLGEQSGIPKQLAHRLMSGAES